MPTFDPRPLPVRSSARSVHRLAARLSWREMRRYPWRSLLIILVIALPAFGIAGVLTFMAYTATTDHHRNKEALMGFDALVVVSDGPQDRHQDPFTLHPLEDSGVEESLDSRYPLPEVGVCGPEKRKGTADSSCSLLDLSWPGAKSYPLWQSPITVDSADRSVPMIAYIADFQDPAWDFWFRTGTGSQPSDQGVALNRAAQRALTQPSELAEDTKWALHGNTLSTVGITNQFSDIELGRALFVDPSAQAPAIFIQAGSRWAKHIEATEPRALLVNGPAVKDYRDVGEFTVDGFAVLADAVLTNPPVPAAQPKNNQLIAYVMVLLVGMLGLLETGLIASAAFAVGARRQQRSLALLAVTGVEARTVKLVMLYNGLISGLIGTVLGMFGGSVLAQSLVTWWRQRGGVTFDPEYPVGFYVAAAVIIVASSLAAAYLPARRIGKLQAWDAARGSQTLWVKPNTKIALLGAMLAIVSVLLLLIVTVHGMLLTNISEVRIYEQTLAWSIGILMPTLLIGFLLLLASYFQFIFRFADRLPLSGRIAMREALRNRSRVLPVTAAIMVASMLGSLFLVADYAGGHQNHGKQLYGIDTNTDSAGVVFLTDHERDDFDLRREQVLLATDRSESNGETTTSKQSISEQQQSITAALSIPHLPTVVQTGEIKVPIGTCATDNDQECTILVPEFREDSLCRTQPIRSSSAVERWEKTRQIIDSWPRQRSQACDYYNPHSSERDQLSDGQVVIADEQAVEHLLTRELSATEREKFQRGHAVVFDPEYFSADQTVSLVELVADLPTALQEGQTDQGQLILWSPTVGGNPVGTIRHKLRLPAFSLENLSPDHVYPRVILPEQALKGTAQKLVTHAMTLEFASALSKEQTTQVSELVQLAGFQFSNPTVRQAHQPNPWFAWGLVLVLLIAIGTLAVATTALATADAKLESRVMTVVGAPPSVRRNVAAWQAVLTVGTGTMVGAVLGILPTAVAFAVDQLRFPPIPVPHLLVLVLGITTVSAVLSWLFVPRVAKR